MATCGRCGQRIARGRIPGRPQTWTSTETGALCEWIGPGGQEMTSAHYPEGEGRCPDART